MEHNRLSRRRKNEKRRSVNRSIIAFSAIAILLLAGLFLVPKLKGQTESKQANSQKTETIPADANNSEEATEKEQEKDENGDDQDEAPSDSTKHADDQDETDLKEKDSDEKNEGTTNKTNDQQDRITKRSNGKNDQTSSDRTTGLSKEDQRLQSKYDAIQKKKVNAEDPNVIEAYEADWPPVGTSQKEPHEATYEVDTVDWQEMVQAIELVTPLDDMIIHWIGNDGPGKAIATVSTEKWDEIYRIYLSWVKHEGWKPTRIEQLEWLQIIK